MTSALLLATSLAAVMLTLPSTIVSAAETSRLMIVFDGSGSMWGQIPGGDASKLQLMRRTLDNALANAPGTLAVGLTTFGAQSNGSCSATNTPIAPIAGSAGRITESLTSFNPQGRGPLVLGLRRAIAALGNESLNSRILLIHDGPDNCGRDVCALAAELDQTRANVRVDVVSLALKADQRGTLGCLAAATGGTVVEASNARAATLAVEQVLAKLIGPAPQANARNNPSTGSSASPADPAALREQQTAQPDTGIRFTAVLKGQSNPLTNGISWQIARLDGAGNAVVGKRQVIDQANGSIQLDPGRFRVTMKSPIITRETVITVEKGATQNVRMEIDGGRLKVPNVATYSGNYAVDTERFVTVTRIGKEPAVVWKGYERQADQLLLPSGQYRIRMGNGLKSEHVGLVVESGKQSDILFAARPGRLELTVTGLDPDPLSDAHLTIRKDTAGSSEPSPVLLRSTALKNASFELPAGSYRVSVHSNDGRRDEVVVLVSGQTTSRVISLRRMALRVTTHIGNKDAVSMDKVRLRLWRAGQLERPLKTKRAAKALFQLAPGRYRIESRVGLQNAVMIREFDVGLSAYGALAMRHEAGGVRLRLPSDAKSAAGFRKNVYWEVLDRDGRLLWRSFDPEPRVILNAGAYTTTVNIQGQRYASKFIVVTGHEQTVTPAKE